MVVLGLRLYDSNFASALAGKFCTDSPESRLSPTSCTVLNYCLVAIALWVGGSGNVHKSVVSSINKWILLFFHSDKYFLICGNNIFFTLIM
jgi:hypothetical protein